MSTPQPSRVALRHLESGRLPRFIQQVLDMTETQGFLEHFTSHLDEVKRDLEAMV